ncbi:hydroxyquinol 1,2-dioxygenase (plasmid) [Cupriavidus sp. KK10]|uniref:hydroxyquinol 1,2-dioxygenase n=1 Tax=Cupriavidus sp. KK10 TaxID=1478019 RepID=UPI001BAC5304|nr:hydroxyquinol 1,2-dioxygenase [Cupriavidus sp. KK10]QUN32444.1 hydroxyquinol 1,2-dioxygenase [Cupriavidus sp. KK10]
MNTNIAKRLVLIVALLAGAAGAHATSSNISARDPYTDGARTVQGARDPYTDGARTVQGARDPYTDGARNVDPHDHGERFLAGMDRTGVSAQPAGSADPYLDGAYA